MHHQALLRHANYSLLILVAPIFSAAIIRPTNEIRPFSKPCCGNLVPIIVLFSFITWCAGLRVLISLCIELRSFNSFKRMYCGLYGIANTTEEPDIADEIRTGL